eukprot:2769210-Pleurochrysis_carterae.AAC.1
MHASASAPNASLRRCENLKLRLEREKCVVPWGVHPDVDNLGLEAVHVVQMRPRGKLIVSTRGYPEKIEYAPMEVGWLTQHLVHRADEELFACKPFCPHTELPGIHANRQGGRGRALHESGSGRLQQMLLL